MASNLFVTSDLHLGHTNLLRGQRIGIRPFDTLTEMHEAIVQNWNRVVGPHDKVYVLGDVTLSRSPESLEILRELKGKLRLVLGNHDHQPLTTYLVYFEKVFAVRTLADVVLTHIPLHPVEFDRWRGNIHGHKHEQHIVVQDKGDPEQGEPMYLPPRKDPRYVNACLEVNDYTPQPFDVLRERLGP